MAVSYRTDARQTYAVAELAVATGSPYVRGALSVTGVSRAIATENGDAVYHQVRFGALTPGTRYVYRVQGADGWSEWRSFRTASDEPVPFRFLYFGDLQNSILEHGARTVRQAYARAGEPALVIHAGDLVASRDDMAHDDEWGEWNAAGGHFLGMIPQAPAAGNHEYVDVSTAAGAETRALAPHWPLQFALPDNGAEQTRATTYYVDYQGVRFVFLDGTAALDLGALNNQTAWLRRVLESAGERWTVVVVHQPIFTCARPEDTQPLNQVWRPVFDELGVDLVLQGHDHCYGRWADPPSPAEARARARRRVLNGPVYIVSVAGRKMYGLNDRVRRQADRWAEDTQLFQIIDVERNRLRYHAFMSTGDLYDAFDLVRGRNNRLIDRSRGLGPNRECSDGVGPDASPCSAEAKD
jgi:hypothetical protein